MWQYTIPDFPFASNIKAETGHKSFKGEKEMEDLERHYYEYSKCVWLKSTQNLPLTQTFELG